MLSITQIRCLSGVMLTLLAMTPAQGQQQQPDAVAEVNLIVDRTPEKCLSPNMIRRTVAVDDRTVLFYVRGGDVYQNILPRECPGLKRNDRFMYEPFSNRLCNTDTITVLERFGGRFNRGSTCRLGEYHPLSELEAEELLASDALAPRSSAVEATPPELSDDADEADAE